MASTRRLAILEADWFAGYNHTVKPFFEGLSRSVYEQPDAFHYERFVGQQSFTEALTYLARKADVRYLYLASHGRPDYVVCPNGDKIRRKSFDDLMEKGFKGRRLDGLYLASCLFGTKKTAELLWAGDAPRTSRLKWVAGYTEEIDWIESMSLDMMFWSALLTGDDDGADKPIARLQYVVDYLLGHMPELMRSLQFHVYVRKSGSGEIVDLVEEGLAKLGPPRVAVPVAEGATKARRPARKRRPKPRPKLVTAIAA